ncbi:MAG: methylenetetrahydrofolate reductase C-terminal domain-containing protein [Candidatus Sumerlaeota bacterium]|nr:methylenetetrahydrofolate reductase C-terminal domain-containing protein [Candidatus Sumerlaeota bacterium]
MIVADRKKIPEIRDMIKNHNRVLLVGCGTCVTVCLAGGERETGILGSALRMSLKLIGRGNIVVDECVIERQCEDAFTDLLAPRVAGYDAICSLGCGAGVQALAERFPQTPVYPGLNTEFIGICPITRCAKPLFNGPCGGSREGKCEVNPDLECGWQLICDRAKSIGVLDRLATTIAPTQDWSTSLDGGPRKVIREDQRIAGLGPKA